MTGSPSKLTMAAQPLLPATNIQLETARLRLVPWRADHLEPLAAMWADTERMRFTAREPMSRENCYFTMAIRTGHLALHGFGVLAIEEKATGSFVGWCGPRHPVDIPEPDLMYSLAPAFEARGYADEAARAALDWCFGPIGFASIAIMIAPENAKSIRVAERLGARLEDTRTINGRETLVYRVMATAWLAQKDQGAARPLHPAAGQPPRAVLASDLGAAP